VPEAGGHPARLVAAAAEYVRAANHATIVRRPVPGLAAGSDAYDTVGALYQLISRLPQLCAQLGAVLEGAAPYGTLTGPEGAPDRAAAALRRAATVLENAALHLDDAWQTLSPVGGWLSADAQALAGDGEE